MDARERVGRESKLIEQSGRGAEITDDTETRKVRVAEYVRISTKYQKYSTENQSDAIRSYAERHDMVIVKTYSDAGKSGLKIEGRKALRQLVDDVEGGDAGVRRNPGL